MQQYRHSHLLFCWHLFSGFEEKKLKLRATCQYLNLTWGVLCISYTGTKNKDTVKSKNAIEPIQLKQYNYISGAVLTKHSQNWELILIRFQVIFLILNLLQQK